jgi:hypothetical protein
MSPLYPALRARISPAGAHAPPPPSPCRLHGISVGERERTDLWKTLGALLELIDCTWRSDGDEHRRKELPTPTSTRAIERAAELLDIRGGAASL